MSLPLRESRVPSLTLVDAASNVVGLESSGEQVTRMLESSCARRIGASKTSMKKERFSYRITPSRCNTFAVNTNQIVLQSIPILMYKLLTGTLERLRNVGFKIMQFCSSWMNKRRFDNGETT
jgi:hypothetical protein